MMIHLVDRQCNEANTHSDIRFSLFHLGGNVFLIDQTQN